MARQPSKTAADGGRTQWRHQALAERLFARIQSEAYPVGASLPTERQIAETEKVSRATVREALRALENRGLIRRRQGSGTVVVSAAPQRISMALEGIEGLLMLPAGTRAHIHGNDVLDAGDFDLAANDLPAERSWRRITFMRFPLDSNVPVSHSHAYLRDDYGDALSQLTDTDDTIVHLVETRYGLKRGQVRLQVEATTVTGRPALDLGVPEGTAAIRIVRRYFDDAGELYDHSVSIYPQDRYAFELVLPGLGTGTAS